jgi:hypothetical protein
MLADPIERDPDYVQACDFEVTAMMLSLGMSEDEIVAVLSYMPSDAENR